MDRDPFPPSEIRHLESMIASMRVNELQTVLSMFKMPKLGKKQELIQRCTDLLRTPALQLQVANQVKILVGKNSNRAAPYTVPIRTCMPNGLMMNGGTAYGGYRHGTGAQQLLHQMQSTALHQQARILRNIVPIPLPFYDSHKTILEPMELPGIMSGVKTPCKQTFTFSLPREYFLSWSTNAPLPRYEMQLRFFQVPENYASQELPDDFPLNCVARIEEQHVQLPALIPTNKPNVEPKRPSRPVDITQYCLNVRDHSRPMRLVVEWTGDKRAWAVAIYLVYRVTSEILRDRATGAVKNASSGDSNSDRPNHRQEERITRDLIRARLGGGNDDDIAMAQLKISLLCPLSRTRISLPARCRLCNHLQCFDLYNYLQMNEKRPTWRCPVCSGPAHFKNVIIDEYFQNMLANVDSDTTEVELLVDGSYKTVKPDCVDIDDDDVPSSTAPGENTSGAGTPSTSTPSSLYPSHARPKSHEDDIIVLSDSDDDDHAVEQAIRASMVDSSHIPAPKQASPTPRSRDSSIIIIDDESPPRPTPQSVQNKSCNGSTSSLGTLSPPSTSAGTIAAPVACSSTMTSNGVMPSSRVAAPQPHSVLSGHQNIYNSTTPLSYYHQSQWSQPAASRPQYPTSQSQTSSLTGSAFSLSYKPPQPPPMSTLLGRYQPAASALPFSYGATATSAQPFSTSGPNLQQVLASLVQQSQYANGTAGTASGNTSQ